MTQIYSSPIITYILVLPPGLAEDQTPFQGFSTTILGFAEIIRYITTLPASFVEMYLDRDQVIFERSVHGGYQIIPLSVTALSKFPGYPAARFIVLVSYNATREATASYVRNSEYPCLHVSTIGSSEIPSLAELTREHLAEYCKRAIAFISERYANYSVPDVGKVVPQGRRPLSDICLLVKVVRS